MLPNSRFRAIGTTYAQRRNEPPKKIAVFAEYLRPKIGKNQPGMVLSLGSIGAQFQIAKTHTDVSKLFFGSLEYLSNLNTENYISKNARQIYGCPWVEIQKNSN